MSRENLTVRVRNVLGIIKADLDLRGVVLVAGVNAAGKSSLLEAVGACIVGEPRMRGLRTKTDQAKAIHEGAKAGSVAITYAGGDGSLRLTLPDGEMEQKGRPVFLGSALGIGRQRFMLLKEDERTREFFDRTKAHPKIEDLKTWFAAHPGSGLEHDARAGELDALWTDLTDNGWDAIAKGIQEYGTKRKGAWEQLTSDKWGSKKAQNWTPVGLDPESVYVLADEQENLAKAREYLATLTAADAAATINREQLNADIKAAVGLKAKLDDIGTERAAIQRQIDDKAASRRAIVLPGETGKGSPTLSCPHCGKPVKLNRDANSALLLQKAEAVADPAKQHDMRLKAAELDQEIATLQGQAKKLADDDIELRLIERRAEEARGKLEQAKAAGPLDKELIDSTRATLLQAERTTKAVELMERAAAIYADWERNSVLLEALQPSGVRQVVLERHISTANINLAAITQAAGMRSVTFTSNLSTEYDGRPYQLCSESERWRVDFALAVLWHQMEDATVLLLDRFDVVVAQDQGPIIMALKKLKVTALVAMTAKERARVPDLDAAKVGSALWVDAGVVGPCR